MRNGVRVIITQQQAIMKSVITWQPITRPAIMLLAIILLAIVLLTGCGSANSATANVGSANSGSADAATANVGSANSGSADAGKQSDDLLVKEWDHVSMLASEETTAQVLQSDAQILEERLSTYAGEGKYRMEVTLPQDNEADAAGRIDIYMDPEIKGDGKLSFLSRVFVSGNLRYSLYSVEMGYLNVAGNEAYNVPLEPSDIVEAEVTEDYPEELSPATWDKTPAIRIRLSEDFLKKYGQTIATWTRGIGILADIEDRTYKEYEESFAIDNMRLTPTQEPGVYYIFFAAMTDREREHVVKSLKKDHLSGSYEVAVSPAIDWNGAGLDSGSFEHLYPADGFEEACAKAGAEETSAGTEFEETSAKAELEEASARPGLAQEIDSVTFTLYQNDRDMESGERTELLNSFCSRMDALGMPYCIGEIKGLKGTVAVKTLPDHINEDVITILQNDSPLNLAAGTRKINLKGGLYEAKVITLEGGNLALDLSMTTGGKDSVYAMTREMELLGGGDTIIYLMRSKPICGCYTGSAIKDGHLILDKNYTGIGGSAWNAGNRWILDLLCSVINHSGYPVQKLKTETEKYLDNSAFKTGEHFVTDSTGSLYVPDSAGRHFVTDIYGKLFVPEQSGFTEDATVADIMQKLAKIAPAAALGDKSDFDKEYGIYNIHLNLEIPEEEYDAEAADYLIKVRKMIQTGPILNARVYLTEGAQDSVSMFTYWENSEIKTEENYPVTEAYHSMEMSKMFRDNPGIMFTYIDFEKLTERIKNLLER